MPLLKENTCIGKLVLESIRKNKEKPIKRIPEAIKISYKISKNANMRNQGANSRQRGY